jgi:hypothetical protein
MKWLKALLGIKTSDEKLRQKIRDCETKSFLAQRRGDMEEAGVWKAKAEEVAAKLEAKSE